MEIVTKTVSLIIRLQCRKILDEKYISDNDKIHLMKTSDRALGENYPNILSLLT